MHRWFYESWCTDLQERWIYRWLRKYGVKVTVKKMMYWWFWERQCANVYQTDDLQVVFSKMISERWWRWDLQMIFNCRHITADETGWDERRHVLVRDGRWNDPRNHAESIRWARRFRRSLLRNKVRHNPSGHSFGQNVCPGHQSTGKRQRHHSIRINQDGTMKNPRKPKVIVLSYQRVHWPWNFWNI